MTIKFNIEYDLAFEGLNGEDMAVKAVNFFAPVSAGDVILWYNCELEVDFITHFYDGQRPTINAHITSGK